MKVKKRSTRSRAHAQKIYARNNRSQQSSTIVQPIQNSISEVFTTDSHIFISEIDELVSQSILEYDSFLNVSNDIEEEWQNVLENLNLNMSLSDQQIAVSNTLSNDIQTFDENFDISSVDFSLTNFEIKCIKKFESSCINLKWNICDSCGRSFPNLVIIDYKCKFCIKYPNRWTNINNMDPRPVPPELKCLTDIEAMVIAMVQPIMSVQRYKGHGQHFYSGNVINFPQQIDKYITVLPHIPIDIPYLIIFHRKFDKSTLKCIARPEKLKTALLWLKANNKWYKNITISEENLSQYPKDGNISSLLKFLQIDIDDDINSVIEEYSNSFVPNAYNIQQDKIIYEKLNIKYPDLDSTPINEFSKDGYISKAFPILFPYGTADFSDCRIDDKISFGEYCKFLLQYKDRRFAQDYRFRYFLLNTHLRHQMISQARMYVKQGHWVDSDTLSFKDAIEKNPKFLDGIISFNKKIKGTTSFWKTKCAELITMCQQLGSPTVFFTLSAADYHWPDLYKILAPDLKFEDLSDNDRKVLMHRNPILTSFFFNIELICF